MGHATLDIPAYEPYSIFPPITGFVKACFVFINCAMFLFCFLRPSLFPSFFFIDDMLMFLSTSYILYPILIPVNTPACKKCFSVISYTKEAL